MHSSSRHSVIYTFKIPKRSSIAFFRKGTLYITVNRNPSRGEGTEEKRSFSQNVRDLIRDLVKLKGKVACSRIYQNIKSVRTYFYGPRTVCGLPRADLDCKQDKNHDSTSRGARKGLFHPKRVIGGLPSILRNRMSWMF